MIKMGIGLYMIREAMDEDFIGTLKILKGWGYEGVELWKMLYKHDPAFVADALAQTGLEAASWHTDLESLMFNLDDIIAYNKKAGNRTIMLNYLLPIASYSLDAIKAVAKWIDTVVAKVSDEGMRFGVHNHGTAMFDKYDGVSAWDYFIDNCDARFALQLDVGTAAMGGYDLPELILRSGERLDSIHIKPHTFGLERGEASAPMIGEDSLDYAKILEACKKTNMQWYLVEYEARTRYMPMYAARLCMEKLRQRGF